MNMLHVSFLCFFCVFVFARFCGKTAMCCVELVI